jgi:hypothetical protein
METYAVGLYIVSPLIGDGQKLNTELSPIWRQDAHVIVTERKHVST